MLPASTLDEEIKSSLSRATTGESSEFNPVDERQDACMGHVENKSENTSNVREAIVSSRYIRRGGQTREEKTGPTFGNHSHFCR
jgi:hypothetical protein